MPEFAASLIAWQRRHGRHGLPWQGRREPYRVWLAEVMLQQTQVAAMIPYYERFLARFPDLGTLAAASQDEVLRLWSGLGYYARGRNLHAAARAMAARGGFPTTEGALAELPGVGRSTAAAIAVFAFGRRAAILDGNAKRVFARCFGVEGEHEQWRLAQSLLPRSAVRTYTQALMDLGATVCTRAKPACERCPVAARCVARREDRIGDLPRRRARAPLPLRRATWYVLLHQGRVLLERRPGAGLWGGLWTFPERRPRGSGKLRRLAPLEHGFTHFRLRAQPLVGTLRRATPGQMWLDIEDAVGAAVPAPVRSVLKGLLAA